MLMLTSPGALARRKMLVLAKLARKAHARPKMLATLFGRFTTIQHRLTTDLFVAGNSGQLLVRILTAVEPLFDAANKL